MTAMQTGGGVIASVASIAKCQHGLTFGTNQEIQLNFQHERREHELY